MDDQIAPAIRPMTRKDIPIILQWCIRENWIVSSQIWLNYYACDPNGHFIMDYRGNPIAEMSIIKHSDDFYTLGPFIVEKTFRKQGLGNRLWNTAFEEKLKNITEYCIVLCAVPEQVKRYEKHGFRPLYSNEHWLFPSSAIHNKKTSIKSYELTQDEIQQIAGYDRDIFFSSRETLLTTALKNPSTKKIYTSQNNKITGYGLLMPYESGYRVGPVMADNDDIATEIYKQLILLGQGHPLFTDTPSDNILAHKLMCKFGAQRLEKNDTIAMVKKTDNLNINLNIKKYYSIFSLEVG